ncbi:MAG TPA: thiamine phosphate synthase [Candidatus Acidoferrum sp.]
MSPQNSGALVSGLRSGKKRILCYVTDRHSLRTPAQTDSLQPLLEKIELLAAAGIDWIQLREKDLSGKQSAVFARDALRGVSNLARQAPIPGRILVNDRLDVAIAEQADGAHLGENSLAAGDAVRLVRSGHVTTTLTREFLVGVSTHSRDAAKSAASAGVDYVFFGPVFATPSKAAYGSPQGLEQLAEVCASVTIPVLAIGGITLENASACFSAGAAGIAAIRLFQDSTDPAAIIRALHGHTS